MPGADTSGSIAITLPEYVHVCDLTVSPKKRSRAPFDRRARWIMTDDRVAKKMRATCKKPTLPRIEQPKGCFFSRDHLFPTFFYRIRDAFYDVRHETWQRLCKNRSHVQRVLNLTRLILMDKIKWKIDALFSLLKYSLIKFFLRDFNQILIS